MYLGVLFALGFIGLSLAAAGTLWSTAAKREREEQLLWTGNEFRRAIASYYLNGPQGLLQYPSDLSELIEDRRGPILRRHLRRIYPDPMSGHIDWQIIRAAEGSIIGISSSSPEWPLKVANFAPADAAFQNSTCYCDWRFIFLPQLAGLDGTR